MSEMSTGVQTLIARMATNPEEFFGETHKWRFMFKETYRDVMTELEKGALHAALKEVRRKEFDALVVQTLLNDEAKERAYAQAQAYTGQNLAMTLGASTGTTAPNTMTLK